MRLIKKDMTDWEIALIRVGKEKNSGDPLARIENVRRFALRDMSGAKMPERCFVWKFK
jgi:hypothetical protein